VGEDFAGYVPIRRKHAVRRRTRAVHRGIPTVRHIHTVFLSSRLRPMPTTCRRRIEVGSRQALLPRGRQRRRHARAGDSTT